MVWKLQKSQDVIDVLSRNLDQFRLFTVETNITIEFGNVFYRKVIENLLSFPTV